MGEALLRTKVEFLSGGLRQNTERSEQRRPYQHRSPGLDSMGDAYTDAPTMSPISTPMIVTAFQPDISGNVFVCAQSQDGSSNLRILITQQQKNGLAVGDSLNAVLSSDEIAGVELNPATRTSEEEALRTANAELEDKAAANEAELQAANTANAELIAQANDAQAKADAAEAAKAELQAQLDAANAARVAAEKAAAEAAARAGATPAPTDEAAPVT